jgi:hypothetical protein
MGSPREGGRGMRDLFDFVEFLCSWPPVLSLVRVLPKVTVGREFDASPGNDVANLRAEDRPQVRGSVPADPFGRKAVLRRTRSQDLFLSPAHPAGLARAHGDHGGRRLPARAAGAARGSPARRTERPRQLAHASSRSTRPRALLGMGALCEVLSAGHSRG